MNNDFRGWQGGRNPWKKGPQVPSLSLLTPRLVYAVKCDGWLRCGQIEPLRFLSEDERDTELERRGWLTVVEGGQRQDWCPQCRREREQTQQGDSE